MKKGLLVAAALGLTLILSGFSTKEPAKTKPKAAMDARPMSQEKMTVVKDQAAWSQAQAWLQSIGYDRTIDQMKTMTRLVLQKYSVQTVSLITDENMRHVALLTNLEELLVHRQIGDAGVKYFAGLTKLKVLNMPNTRITDNGMQYLAGMTRMESLVLAGTAITDAGLAQIGNLGPAILNLNGTGVTDAGLNAYLPGRGFQFLALSRTNITDAVVPALANINWLDRLDIQGTNISEQGYQQLRTAKPHTQIYYRPNGVPNS